MNFIINLPNNNQKLINWEVKLHSYRLSKKDKMIESDLLTKYKFNFKISIPIPSIKKLRKSNNLILHFSPSELKCLIYSFKSKIKKVSSANSDTKIITYPSKRKNNSQIPISTLTILNKMISFKILWPYLCKLELKLIHSGTKINNSRRNMAKISNKNKLPSKEYQKMIKKSNQLLRTWPLLKYEPKMNNLP